MHTNSGEPHGHINFQSKPLEEQYEHWRDIYETDKQLIQDYNLIHVPPRLKKAMNEMKKLKPLIEKEIAKLQRDLEILLPQCGLPYYKAEARCKSRIKKLKELLNV